MSAKNALSPEAAEHKRVYDKARNQRPEVKARNAEISRQWRDRNKESRKSRSRRWLYGISSDQIREMLVSQDGLCAACYGEPATDVDHDHVTGSFRGMLCRKCNLGIGHFDDSPDKLRSAADYLEGK